MEAQAPAPTAETWNAPGPQPTPANPFAALGKFSRADRKLAREVIADAAETCGMTRLQFMRAVRAGDQKCVDEMKVSLAMSDDAPGFDLDQFQQILNMILDFIARLLELFGLFAMDQPASSTMAVIPFALAA